MDLLRGHHAVDDVEDCVASDVLRNGACGLDDHLSVKAGVFWVNEGVCAFFFFSLVTVVDLPLSGGGTQRLWRSFSYGLLAAEGGCFSPCLWWRL